MRIGQRWIACCLLVLVLSLPQGQSCATNDQTILGNLLSLLGIVNLGCLTQGVFCDDLINQCVVGLVLTGVGNAGSIPSKVGDLPNLTFLNITNTNYTGIPSTFTTLSKLQSLDLSNNKLSTGLNYLAAANLSQLTSLKLDNNKFTGLVPAFGKLPNLQTFSAVGNKITGFVDNGTFLAGATALKVLDLSNNLISAVPPTLLITLHGLGAIVQQVIFANNLASGLLLDIIQVLANLPINFVLDLSGNFLCGLIPPLASRIIAPTRIILNNNCFFTPLPNWCAKYASTCAFMKSSTLCDPVTQFSYCPPVNSGSQSLASPLAVASVTDGPTITLTPVDPFTGSTISERVSLRLNKISEVDASNNPIGSGNTTQLVPSPIGSRYYLDDLTTSIRNGLRVSTILDNGAFLFWEVFLGNNTFTKDYVSISRSIQSSVITELMEISYWPSVNSNTAGFSLDFDIDFGGSQITKYNNATINGSIFDSFSGASEFESNFLLEAANTLVLNMTLVNVAFGNNNQSANITHQISFNESDWSIAKLRALIPFTFYPSLYYDPDMGALYASGDSGNDGNGDGWNDAYVAAIVVPVVMVALAVPAVAIAIAMILLVKKLVYAAKFSTNGPELETINM